jgi:hypothetical protein
LKKERDDLKQQQKRLEDDRVAQVPKVKYVIDDEIVLEITIDVEMSDRIGDSMVSL